jgi:hypothetical protein
MIGNSFVTLRRFPPPVVRRRLMNSWLKYLTSSYRSVIQVLHLDGLCSDSYGLAGIGRLMRSQCGLKRLDAFFVRS